MIRRPHKKKQRGATVVFGVIGAAIGAVVDVANPAQGAMWGWSIGTVVGGLLFPPSMPANALGKLDDLRVTSSSYGTFIPQLWGSTRIAGQIIWATDLVEHQSQQGGSGKGGSAGSVTVYTYTSSFAVLVGRGPLKSVDKILFNEQVVYDTTQTPNTSAGLTVSGIYLGDELQDPDPFMTSVLASNSETSPAYRGYCYIVFENVDLTNYGNRLPNIQFETTGFGTIAADTLTDVSAQCGLAAPIWTMAGAGTTTANGPYTFISFHDVNGSLVYSNGINMLYFDDPTGDWVIAATVGGTKLYEVSGGTWSQIPLTGWTVVTGTPSAPIVTYTPVDYDYSLATDNVIGYINPTRQMGKAAIEPLATALFADIIESDGIRWVPRGAPPVRTLSTDDLGAVNWSVGSGLDEDTILVKYKRQQDWEIPSCVQVTYYQWNSNPIARNYLQASQSAIRSTKNDMQNVQQITFPMIMDDTFARQLAESLLYTAWTEQDSFDIATSQKNSDLIPSDVIFIPHGGLMKRTRVIQSNMAMPGISQLSLVLDDWSTLFQYIEGAATGGNGSSGTLGSTNIALAFQSNAFSDTIAKQNEVHIWLAAAWTQASTPGSCSIYISTDGGTSYQLTNSDGAGGGWLRTSFFGSKNIPSVMGSCLSALGTWSDYTMMDTTNTLQITLAVDGQTLESCSTADLASGMNALWINNEIIQFQTASLVSGNTFEISNLLRGQRGTDPFMSTHSIAEIAVMVQSSLGVHVLFPPPLGGDSALGSSILIKFVFPGQSLSGVTPQTIVLGAPELRPYKVVSVSGARDIPLNLTVTWTGRPRFAGYYPYSINEADTPIEYGVRIYTDGTYTIIARSVVVSSATYIYSATDQTTDFGSPQATVYLKIYQNSPISSVGEGYQWQGTV